jgi:hypothetical protein
MTELTRPTTIQKFLPSPPRVLKRKRKEISLKLTSRSPAMSLIQQAMAKARGTPSRSKARSGEEDEDASSAVQSAPPPRTAPKSASKKQASSSLAQPTPKKTKFDSIQPGKLLKHELLGFTSRVVARVGGWLALDKLDVWSAEEFSLVSGKSIVVLGSLNFSL